ncbi:MAG TPA: MarR family transcriptional regulator [Methanoregula sp.]|nr:MarR family transcriptional regulator [Methanoregula sp.]
MHSDSCLIDEIPLGAVISITGRARSIFFNDRLRIHGLTAGQFPVLMLLCREQNITQDALVRHYHLDKGTIARAVRKLEERGYVRRITDPHNRRAVRLFLTKTGEAVIPALLEINREWEEFVLRDLDMHEKKVLRTLMGRVAGRSFVYMEKSGSGHYGDE